MNKWGRTPWSLITITYHKINIITIINIISILHIFEGCCIWWGGSWGFQPRWDHLNRSCLQLPECDDKHDSDVKDNRGHDNDRKSLNQSCLQLPKCDIKHDSDVKDNRDHDNDRKSLNRSCLQLPEEENMIRMIVNMLLVMVMPKNTDCTDCAQAPSYAYPKLWQTHSLIAHRSKV